MSLILFEEGSKRRVGNAKVSPWKLNGLQVVIINPSVHSPFVDTKDCGYFVSPE